MNAKTKRKIERILALGYLEANANHRSSSRARLNVLTEVSAAVCDLVLPDPHSGNFQLANVVVKCGDQICGRTLAPFDAEIEKLFRVVDVKVDDNWSLKLPEAAEEVHKVLQDFWKVAVTELELDMVPLLESPSIAESSSVRTLEFHNGLRDAFDAIIRDGPESAFTLRVQPCADGYRVGRNVGCKMALGYCLPRSQLVRVGDQLTRYDNHRDESVLLKMLEMCLIPLNGNDAFRSHSHTNITTQAAGLVRGQEARSKGLAKSEKFRVLDDDVRKTVGEGLDSEYWYGLEKAVWQGSKKSIFVMPLTNHAFSDDQNLQPLALWYIAFDDNYDVEELLAQRYRADLVFTATIYSRYCEALSRSIAAKILSARRSSEINSECMAVQQAFGLTMVPTILDKKDCDRKKSLRTDIDELRKVSNQGQQVAWGPEIEGLLGGIVLDVVAPSTRRSSTFKTDILAGLIQNLELENSRNAFRRHVWGYQTFMNQADNLSTKLRDSMGIVGSAMEIVGSAIAGFGVSRVDWPRLKGLQGAYAGTQVHESNKIIQLKNWNFQLGHNLCSNAMDCRRCGDEFKRRSFYIMGGEVSESSDANQVTPIKKINMDDLAEKRRAIFEKFYDKNKRSVITSWDITKHACGSREGYPTVASLAVLLLMEGVYVEVEDRLATKGVSAILPSYDDWDLSLAGIAGLAKIDPSHSKTDDRPSTISISKDNDKLVFTLTGLRYDEWFEKAREKCSEVSPNVTASGQRKKQIAATYQWKEQSKLPGEDTIKNVTLKVCGESLQCIWTSGLPTSA